MDDEIVNVVSGAIQSAKVKSSNAGHGTTWDPIFVSNEESRHFAEEIISELTSAGYRVIKDGK